MYPPQPSFVPNEPQPPLAQQVPGTGERNINIPSVALPPSLGGFMGAPTPLMGGGVASNMDASLFSLDMDAYMSSSVYGNSPKERMRNGIASIAQYLCARYLPFYTGPNNPNALADMAQKAFLRFDNNNQPSKYSGDPNTELRHQYINLLWATSLIVLGEFASKPFTIDVRAQSPAATNRKEQTRIKMLVDRRIKQLAKGIQREDPEFAQQLSQAAGDVLMAPQDYDTENPDGIEQYLDERGGRYRDVLCDYIYRDLMRWIESTNFVDWLNTCFKKFWLTNRAHANPEIDTSFWDVVNPEIDPLSVLYDPQVRSEFFDDQNFEFFASYMSLGEVLSRWPSINMSDLQQGFTNINNIYGIPLYKYDGNRNIDSILILEVNFKSTKKKRKTFKLIGDEATLDFNGEDFVYTEDVQEKEVKIRYEEQYYGLLLGGYYLVDYGVKENQLRSVYKPAKVIFNSTHLVLYNSEADSANPAPNNFNRIAQLEESYNYIFYKMMDMLSKIDGVKIVMRTGAIPVIAKGETIKENAREYLQFMKRENILFVDDDAYDNAGRLAIDTIDLTGQNMSLVSSMMAMCDKIRMEINMVMNITPARSGDQGQYTAATIGMQNKQQSDFATASMIRAFNSFVNRHLTKVANQLKICLYWRLKLAEQQNNQGLIDAMDMSLGEMEMSIADAVLTQDYSITVKFGSTDQEAKAVLQTAASAQVANGVFDPDSLLALSSILQSSNLQEMDDELRSLSRTRKREALEMQRLQMEQQAAMAPQVGAQGNPTGAQASPDQSRQSQVPQPMIGENVVSEQGRTPIGIQ